MGAFLDARDQFDDDDLFRCKHCGASDPEDLDNADHNDDCPANPYGYNHPNFFDNFSEEE
jgi:hypothetical protein